MILYQPHPQNNDTVSTKHSTPFNPWLNQRKAHVGRDWIKFDKRYISVNFLTSAIMTSLPYSVIFLFSPLLFLKSLFSTSLLKLPAQALHIKSLPKAQFLPYLVDFNVTLMHLNTRIVSHINRNLMNNSIYRELIHVNQTFKLVKDNCVFLFYV